MDPLRQPPKVRFPAGRDHPPGDPAVLDNRPPETTPPPAGKRKRAPAAPEGPAEPEPSP